MTTEAQQRHKTNKALGVMCKKYYKSLPVNEIAAVLKENGFDGDEMDGIYCGHNGKILEQVGKKTWIYFSWYKMPSGNFEINAYVS